MNEWICEWISEWSNELLHCWANEFINEFVNLWICALASFTIQCACVACNSPKELKLDSGSQEKNDRSNVSAGVLHSAPFPPNFNVVMTPGWFGRKKKTTVYVNHAAHSLCPTLKSGGTGGLIWGPSGSTAVVFVFANWTPVNLA